jgi:hypothetical protein
MLRTVYSLLLRLHPMPFRREYEKQMLAIFDEVAASGSVFELFTDAAVSLFRQWVLRPAFRRTPPDELVPVPSGGVPILKGALEMQAQTWGFGRILLAAGMLGAVTLAIAHVAIGDRAEAAITVSGPADGTAAGNAVMSLASNQFRHATLASVNKVPDSSERNASFTVKFTYDGSYGALVNFVHKHRANRTAGDFEILMISSHALNKWLIPLIAIGVTAVAIALGVAFKLQSVRRTA